MAIDDKTLVENIQKGKIIQATDAITTTYRSELTRLMVVIVDSELAGAAGFTHLINSAPSIKARVIAARIVSEKLQHAEKVLDLLRNFGVDPVLYVAAHAWEARLSRYTDVGMRRVGGDKRLNIFHYPVQGWLDAVVLNTVMGTATVLQLEEYQNCSYGPLASIINPIIEQERCHAEWGERGLAEAVTDSIAREEISASIRYWYPKVVQTFGRSDSDTVSMYQRYRLRKQSNGELLQCWQQQIQASLAAISPDIAIEQA